MVRSIYSRPSTVSHKPPFAHWRLAHRDHLEATWVHFKYERISGLYYGCGRLGHIVAACGFTTDAKTVCGTYGPWLKAEVSGFQPSRTPPREALTLGLVGSSLVVTSPPVVLPPGQTSSSSLPTEVDVHEGSTHADPASMQVLGCVSSFPDTVGPQVPSPTHGVLEEDN